MTTNGYRCGVCGLLFVEPIDDGCPCCALNAKFDSREGRRQIALPKTLHQTTNRMNLLLNEQGVPVGDVPDLELSRAIVARYNAPQLPSPDDAAAVERMARAMQKAEGQDPEGYYALARAALRALWEVTP